jgi:hypothetical protein
MDKALSVPLRDSPVPKRESTVINCKLHVETHFLVGIARKRFVFTLKARAIGQKFAQMGNCNTLSVRSDRPSLLNFD